MSEPQAFAADSTNPDRGFSFVGVRAFEHDDPALGSARLAVRFFRSRIYRQDLLVRLAPADVLADFAREKGQRALRLHHSLEACSWKDCMSVPLTLPVFLLPIFVVCPLILSPCQEGENGENYSQTG